MSLTLKYSYDIANIDDEIDSKDEIKMQESDED